MEIVKCTHCGKDVSKSDAIPCTWKEYNLTWYYCKECNNNCYSGGLKNNNCKIEYIRNTQDPVRFYCRKDFFSLNTIKCIILNFYSRKVVKL